MEVNSRITRAKGSFYRLGILHGYLYITYSSSVLETE